MTIGETTVKNKTGLHARPAATFATMAAKFKSKISIKNLDTDSKEVNAKSVVSVLTLGMSKGTKARITADGEDADEAVSMLTSLIDGGFGEI
ncbi:MAG: HPr family phosphocarrier protein [Oscillospiraceae bacterium]